MAIRLLSVSGRYSTPLTSRLQYASRAAFPQVVFCKFSSKIENNTSKIASHFPPDLL